MIEDQGQAVFAPTRLVEELCQLRQALGAASTSGEFRAQSLARYVEEIGSMLDETPADDAAFDRVVIPGLGDGDWPDWLHQVILEWMPKDLIKRFGNEEESVLNGPMLEIEPQVGEDLAQDLERRGYSCARDDSAISAAAWGK